MDFENLVTSGLDEIRAALRDIDGRLRALEQSEAGTHPLINARLDAAWRKIESHETRIKNAEEQILGLREANRLLTWIGGILGSTVIVWLMMQVLDGIP